MADDTAAAPGADAAPIPPPSAGTVGTAAAEAPKLLTMADVTPEAALNAIRMSEQILAQHRLKPLEELEAKVKAANLPDIAKDIRTLLPLFTRDQDKALFQNAANVLGDAERLVTSVVEANIKLAGVA